MKQLLQIWLIALFVKLIVSAWLPLSPDEAYYWVWSHQLQLSYYDHPPFIAWLFYLGHFLEPFANAVRWPAVIFGHFLFWIWLVILRPWFSDDQLRLWLLFALLAPLPGLGTLIVTPDLPLLVFWSLSLLLAIRYFQQPAAALAFLLGISLGLGFCSKYIIVLFVPSLFLWLGFSGLWRKVVPHHVLWTVLGGLLGCFPVLLWNYHNGWISFRFQIDHGLGAESWNWRWTVEYLLGQVLIIFPPILYLALRRRPSQPLRFLVHFAWFPLLFFLYSSTRGYVEANWSIIAYPSLLALAVYNLRSRALARGVIAFWSILIVLALTEVQFHWIPAPRLTERLHEHELAHPIIQDLPNIDGEPFYADTYQLASLLSYQMKVPVFKMPGLNRVDFYDFLSAPEELPDRFYLYTYRLKKLPRSWLERDYLVTERLSVTEQLERVRIERQ